MVSKAVELAEQLKDFVLFHGHEQLSLAVSKVNHLLDERKVRGPKSLTTITEFFCHEFGVKHCEKIVNDVVYRHFPYERRKI